MKKSASQYKTLLARARPHDPAGEMRRRLAAEELADIKRLQPGDQMATSKDF